MTTEAEYLEALAQSRAAMDHLSQLRNWYAERFEDVVARLAILIEITSGCAYCAVLAAERLADEED